MTSGFIWYELMTSDPEAAKAFYGAVVGWDVEALGGPHSGYHILKSATGAVGGMMGLPGEGCEKGARPGWLGYVAVEDCDAAAARIAAAGGTLVREPADIPEVGRFAVVSDPGGAAFMLLQPLPQGDAPPPAPRMTPGHVGWHELHAADGDAAFAFYREQFGWSENAAMDMGPMGTYRLWSTDGGEAVGGMMTMPPQMPQPAWIFYFVVDSVDDAAGRIAEAGGQVVNGPMDVPDGSRIVQAMDPQGAMFALVSPR